MDIECHGEYWTAFQQGHLRPIISEGASRDSAIVGAYGHMIDQEKELEAVLNRSTLWRHRHIFSADEECHPIIHDMKAEVVRRHKEGQAIAARIEIACRSIDVPRET